MEEITTPSWLPPGADSAERADDVFGVDLEAHFCVPDRLADKSTSLVEAVNDFHFAMLNDHARNAFYRDALKAHVRPDDIVLEIGTGSGLLAMLAAKAGAKHVYAVEANKHMAQLARQLIAGNGLSERITVINALSTDVRVGVQLPARADVLVSEILGTLLLGENALQYVADARRRLLKPNARLIPAGGCQFVALIESSEIKSITSVENWDGIDLRGFNALQDTVSVVFTKQYGFRLSSTEHAILVGKTTVADVCFPPHCACTVGLEGRPRWWCGFAAD
jgi:protein arginine N-methyltransferase 7